MNYDVYKEVPYEGSTFQLTVLWDKTTCWLNRKQLELLYHVKEGRLDWLLHKVTHIYPTEHYCHCKKIAVIIKRKVANGEEESDWVHQVNHYDLQFLICLREFKRSKDVDMFLQYAKQKQELLNLA